LNRVLANAFALCVAALAMGCSPDAATPGKPAVPTPALSAGEEAGKELAASDALAVGATTEGPAGFQTPAQLEEAIGKANPGFTGKISVEMGEGGIAALSISDPAIEDIRPLAGLPLSKLDLHGCHVSDIRALEGMPLVVLDLSNTGISDIRVLKGMPLAMVYLENTRVADISALAGAPLIELYLSQTPVADISPLKGSPLATLNLVDTQVEDLRPLAGGRLQSVWLNNTPVKDCAPLASNPVVSVTLADTKVSDISPFKGHPTLQRLHIAGSEVTDLAPLQWMDGLTRLIFTPGRIKTGLPQARKMRSIRQIGTSFGRPGEPEEMYPPEVFWAMYDAGRFN
jgi:Leucine-rich repeat (LRR) protein